MEVEVRGKFGREVPTGGASARWQNGNKIFSLVAKLIKEIGKLLDKLINDGLI